MSKLVEDVFNGPGRLKVTFLEISVAEVTNRP